MADAMVMVVVVMAVGDCDVASTEPASAMDPFLSGGATVISFSQTLPTGVLDSAGWW